jgi:DNA-binding NarL/FixJ family response regulator
MHDLIRVMVIDNQIIVREGLCTLLNRLPEINIIAEVDEIGVALKLINEMSPDIIFVNMDMQGIDRIEITNQILKNSPSCRMIALLLNFNGTIVAELMSAGVRGCISKDCSVQELEQAVYTVNNKKKISQH